MAAKKTSKGRAGTATNPVVTTKVAVAAPATTATGASGGQHFLYSTNTMLAWLIAEQYYASRHFVYCSPHFRDAPNPLTKKPPRSSTPHAIYWELRDDVDGFDSHSAKIGQNRAGLIKGAGVRRDQGWITSKQHDEIVGYVAKAEHALFAPLLYVIPRAKVEHLMQQVPIGNAASPFWVEHIIDALPRDSFDAVELK